MSKQRFLIIVRAEDKGAANLAAKSYFDTEGGEQTFTVPLYLIEQKEDSQPASYVASADVSEENIPRLLALSESFKGSHVLPYSLEQPRFYTETLERLGLRTSTSKL